MRLSFLYLFLLIFLTACGSKDNSEPPAPLPEFQPTLELHTVWTASTGGKSDYFKLEPAFEGEKIFVASSAGDVRALRFENGNVIWKKNLKIPFSGGVGIGEGLVLLGSAKGEVIALRQEDGVESWRTQVSSEILVSPLVSRGIVLVRTSDGKLFGLDGHSGSRLWVYERAEPTFSVRGTSKPIIVEKFIIAGFDNGKLAILDLEKGGLLGEILIAAPKGRFDIERIVDIDANLLLLDRTIYASSYQGVTMALNIFGQKEERLWETDIASLTGFAAQGNTLLTTDIKSHIWALEQHSGRVLWKQDKLGFRGLTAPAVVDDYLIVGDKEGYLHWLNGNTGYFTARYKMGNAIMVAPLVIENTVIAVDSSGKVVALRIRSK